MSEALGDIGTPRRRVTIADIAHAAGVSTATVSHVFSGKQPVSPETSAEVKRAAAAAGYTPNTMARGLATGRSFVVALYISFSRDELAVSPFIASSIVTVSSAVSVRGYALILLPNNPIEAQTEIRRLMSARRIDGVLMMDPSVADAVVANTLRELCVPVVSVGKLPTTNDVVWVDGDVSAQCVDALDHLHERGYRSPALLTLEGDNSFLIESQSAYELWTAQHQCVPVVVKATSVVEDAGERCAGELLSTDFDSVFCISDLMAASLLRELRASGRTGIGVVGTGNSAQARTARPALTSIATQSIDRGRLAADLLITAIDDQSRPLSPITIAHHLVVRDTTPPVEVSL